MKFCNLLASIILLFSLDSKAQDVHFSQVMSFPLLVNPALSGNFNGTSRVIASMRNQNLTVPNSAFSGVYNSLAASYETKIMSEMTGENSLTIGILGTSDYAGSGTLASNDILGNVSYKIALDKYGQTSLALGVQGGLTTKRIFSNDLLFESQVKEFTFDPALPNLETFLDGKTHTYSTFSVGSVFQQSFSESSVGQIGFSLFNFSNPKDLFYSNSNISSYSRLNLHAGVSFDLDESMTLAPSIVYMKQGPATQTNLGMTFTKQMNDDLKLIGGIRTRWNDAFIFIAGLNYKGIQTTFNYDMTNSGLNKANSSVGAFELNLTYIYGQTQESYNSSKLYCPSF